MWESKTCLGVDISGQDIKIVELRKIRDKFQVMQASRLKIGNSDVASVLKQFLSETATGYSKTVMSLPTHECSVKFAQLPKTGASEIAKMARYEAESQIPLPLADLVWNYTAGRPAKSDGLSHVVIAGARRALAQDSVAGLEQTGLPIQAALVASLAEIQVIPASIRTAEHPVVVVNIGEEWTNLTTIKNDRITSCRSLHTGISALQSAVALDLCVETDEARKLMFSGAGFVNSNSSNDQQNIRNSMQWFENLASEIHRSTLTASSGEPDQNSRTAIISGDGAAIRGITEMLSHSTGFTVKTADPWAGMSFSSVVEYSKNDFPAVYSVATGLAISGLVGKNLINLMPSERAEENKVHRKDAVMLTTLGIVLAALLGIFLLGHNVTGKKMEELETLRMKSISANSKHPVSVKPELRKTIALMDKITGDLQSFKSSPLQMLKLLSQNFPKSCWLTEFRYDSGKAIVIRGNSLSNSAVADAVYMLSNTAGFDSVSLDYSNLGKSANTPVYDFQIKCILSPNSSLIGTTSKNRTAKERMVVR